MLRSVGTQSSNKYKNLISNTLIFGISTFGSKVLVLAMKPVTTRILPPGTMAMYDYIIMICNLILPVMYLCIAEAVIRFGMDHTYRRSDVFSIGVYTVLIGYGFLWACWPLMNKIPDLQGYTWLVYLYALTSAMRTVVTNFVRSCGFLRLFALDGIITTATTMGFSLLFLIPLDMGVVGYVLGTIVADAISALGLFFILRLHRFLKIRGINKETTQDMLRYALPLVPTAVAWWVTSLSDRILIRFMVSESVQGIYSQAANIPNLMMLVSTFFTRAWELSAFSEYQSEEGERFFSNVFRSYYTLIFLVSSALILLIKPLTRLLVAETYYISWRYSLFLMLAIAFSCMVTFLGSIYNAFKKNMMVSVTTILGAVVNLVLNLLLIPKFGAEGAAFATFISYLIVFIVRAADTHRYINLQMQPLRIAWTLTLLLLQVYIAMSEGTHWILWECLVFAAIVLSNFGYILFLLRRLWAMFHERFAK